MMGYYPPSSESADKLLKNLGDASPPFHVRDAEVISEQLGALSMPFGFTQIPAFVFEPTDWLSVRTESCPYLEMKVMEGSSSGQVYEGY